MNWKQQLSSLETTKEWDTAIQLLENVINDKPDSLDAYLSINYLLMNLLVEENYNRTKRDYYTSLLKQYFDESYVKFSNNPTYLFYIARIACMSEWYFNIKLKDVENMLQKAIKLDPNNPVYQWTYYANLDKNKPMNKKKIIKYYRLVLQQNSPIKAELDTKGALGKYIFSMMKYIAQEIINE